MSVLRHAALIATLTVCGLLLYLTEYLNVIRYGNLEIDHQTDIQERLEDAKIDVNEKGKNEATFSVNKYNLTNEILELKGSFDEAERSGMYTVHVPEQSHLINQAKPFILEEANRFFKVDRLVKEVDCNAIIHGDRYETRKAENMSKSKPKVCTKPEQYVNLAKNCSFFISKRGYIMNSLTEVEKNFHIAYSILMFKDLEQSERLLRAIYRPQNIYCIHIDKKTSDDIFKAMSYITECFENVFISSKRFYVKWGTMTVLEPELQCMQDLWSKSKTWKYFINLTGQEFPLRTNYELVLILKAYNGSNDIRIVKYDDKFRWQGAGPTPHNIVPTKGSVHIVASRGYVDFVLHDQRAHDFLNWTRRTKVPDETFFSSLNHNPSLGVPGSYKGYPGTEKKNIIKPYLARFKRWLPGSCHGQIVRLLCVFGAADLPLIASRREFFVNKFYLKYQHFALDCVEELHFNRTRDEYLGKLAFDPKWYSQ